MNTSFRSCPPLLNHRFVIGIGASLAVLLVAIVALMVQRQHGAYAVGTCRGYSYSVVSGDTLGKIAQAKHMSLSTLEKANSGIEYDYIVPGQGICVPSQKTVKRGGTSSSSVGGSTMQLIQSVFGAYSSQALAVAKCESGLNPAAYNPSGASGLFQIMPGTWQKTSQAGYSPFNANANARAAYEIFVRDGYSWREWVCKP